MKVLITGKDGQLGYELLRRIPEEAVVHAVDIDTLDITDSAAVDARFASQRPDFVINCAAYTAVDKAESESERARAVNVGGVENVAKACEKAGARLVHVSTDFVFTERHSAPIPVDADPDPAGAYGVTKRDGERVALDLLGSDAAVVRTSWLYSAHGNNFVKTMLRLMNERDSLGVVSDQIGTPTWAGTLAVAIWRLIERENIGGIWHVTDAGVASWYDFAVAIYEDASACGLVTQECDVRPIRTEDYPTPARRPSFSVLDKSRAWEATIAEPVHWRTTLRSMLADVLESTERERDA